MNRKLDCVGKACPIPVVEAIKALDGLSQGDTVEVSVDNPAAVQNLSKMAAQKNLPVSSAKLGNSLFSVTITAAGPQMSGEPEASGIPCGGESGTVVVLSSDRMGEGDEKLGRALMKGYLYALTEQPLLPRTILMYNSGAKLSVLGSDSLQDLKLLESQGVEVLTCGTCLNHYGLTEKLGVGSVTNMYVICGKLSEAVKVIKP